MKAVPYLEFVLDSAMKNQGSLDDPKKKVQVMNTVLPYLAHLPNAVERSDYVFKFARKLGIEDQQLLAETKKAAKQKKTSLDEVPIVPVQSMKSAEKKLLQMLLSNSELQDEIIPLCSGQDFEGLVSEKIFSILLEDFHKNGNVTYDSLHRRLAGEAEQAIVAQLQMEEMPEDASRDTAESFLNALRTLRLTSYKRKIQIKIAEAAERKDDELLNQLIEQSVMVDRELVSLSRK